MRLDRREYYMYTARGLLASPRRLTQGCFHPQVYRRSLYTVPPKSIDFELILSLFASSESLRFSSSLNVFRRELHLPRFFALFATSLVRSHFSRRLPRLRYVPSSGFLNRPTSCSATELAGLFHPAATSRVTPVQGDSLHAQPPVPHRTVCPRRWSGSSSPTCAGCRSIQSSTSRPLSTRGRVHRGSVIHRDTSRSPHRVHLLQARIFSSRSQLTCDTPLATSAPCTFAFAIVPGARPQRISRRKPDGHVSVPPACSSFRAVSPNPPCNFSSAPSARLPA